MADFNILSPLHPSSPNVVAKTRYQDINQEHWKTSISSNIILPGQQELSNSQPPEHTPSSNATNSLEEMLTDHPKTFLWQCLQLWIPNLIIASNGPSMVKSVLYCGSLKSA